MAKLECQKCGAAVPFDEPIPRDAECSECRRDLRCCRNCRHFDPAYNNACRESEADPVPEKERRNFCEFFYFTRAEFRPGAATDHRASDARAKLEGLFGGRPPAERTTDPRKKLEDLFRKPKPADDD
jgi:hypothetical protein